jgi:predicted RNase H-like nuclease (RuvC/YqgF family)
VAEGVLALNRDLRENNARLERHELRERQLGEHLKKTIANLEKHLKHQQANIEGLKDTTNRILNSLDQVQKYGFQILLTAQYIFF